MHVVQIIQKHRSASVLIMMRPFKAVFGSYQSWRLNLDRWHADSVRSMFPCVTNLLHSCCSGKHKECTYISNQV